MMMKKANRKYNETSQSFADEDVRPIIYVSIRGHI